MMINQPTPIQFARRKHQPEKPIPFAERLFAAVVLGSFIYIVILLVSFLVLQFMFIGRIFPGVSVAGIDVGGKTRTEAEQSLNSISNFSTVGRVVLTNGSDRWMVSPASLGLKFDIRQTVQNSMNIGRSGNPLEMINDLLNTFQVGIAQSPIIRFDQAMAVSELMKIDRQLATQPVEAQLVISGTDVSYTPGQAGSGIDIDATLAYINAQLQYFRDGEVQLVMKPKQPLVMDANATAENARAVLANGITIHLTLDNAEEPKQWEIKGEELAGMLRFVRTSDQPGGSYMMAFDADSLRRKLEGIAKEVDQVERDARFTFDRSNSSLVLTQNGHDGFQLNITDTIEQFQTQIALGNSEYELLGKVTPPQVTNSMTATQLGISQLIQSQTSYFWGSSVDRRQNVKTAAANFNGVLVAPGTTFSMGKYMSDVSLENGYAEALIIYNGKTIKGVGGGVCQVSTTLFRTAFFAGFPIKERHSHAYRVYYYEQGPGGGNDPQLSGFDATVYFPLVDFKFENDSPYWILMETVYDDANSSLTWNFYSTPDGRTVDAVFSGPTDVKPALPPVITYNPDAEEGSITHLDYAAEGATINIERKVYKNNALWFNDTFKTEYQPWAEACEYGPGIDDPEKSLKKKGWCQPVE